jgi:Tellurite resistance protein TerB
MAVVGLIFAILGGIGFWWYRAQQVKGAADSVIDAAGKARGMISRARFRQRSGQSVLAGVDSPGMAVATLLYSLAALRRPVTLTDEDKIDGMLETVCRMNKKDREDSMAFAGWASGQVADTIEIVRRFMPIWTDALQPPERQELIDMAVSIASAGAEPTDAQASVIRRLRDGLLPR